MKIITNKQREEELKRTAEIKSYTHLAIEQLDMYLDKEFRDVGEDIPDDLIPLHYCLHKARVLVDELYEGM